MADLFAFLALLLTSASLWLYLACAVAALWLRVVVPVAALGLAFSLWALWGAGPGISSLSLVLMVSGLPLYWWAKREAKPA
jgi:basic amino acid/polyamine antiporter, APA family